MEKKHLKVRKMINEKTNIIKAIEQNLFQFYAFFSKSDFVDYGENKYYKFAKSKNGDWPNYIFDINHTYFTDKKAVDKLKHDILNNNSPPFLIYKYDDSMRSFELSLETIGIRPVMQWKGMALNEKELDFPDIKKDLQIKSVSNPELLKAWFNIVCNEILSRKKINTDIFKDLISTDEIDLFVGLYNNEPVATSLSFNSNNIGGLYLIATKEHLRGMGFGTQITKQTIKNLVSKGVENIVLHSTGLGEKVYKKLGFKEYCKFNIAWMLGK